MIITNVPVPKASSFHCSQTIQHLPVTAMDLPAAELWRLYRGRADCENRIKELKYDFGGDSFNLKDFWATEAALLTVMQAYDLMSLFRQGVMRSNAVSGKPDVQHTFKTLRYKLFAKAGCKSACKDYQKKFKSTLKIFRLFYEPYEESDN
nr:transposase [Nitrosomonas sp.]